jgi:uncharacterized protein (TIGR02285 family)
MRSALLALPLLPSLAGAAPLTLYYIEKPPYYHTEQGEPTGFLLERTRAIFARAGLDVRFEPRPPKRILRELEQQRPDTCSIGWFKTAERERFAWFSRPIHRDAPMLVLTRKSLIDQVRGHARLADLLKSGLRLGLVDGFSYGELDGALKSARSLKVTAPPTQTVLMLAAERIDYTLIDERELPYILAEAGLQDANLKTVRLPDIPAGQQRYLMCSGNLDPSLRQRIDEAIEALAPTP